MSEVEETIERIKMQSGVEAYAICNRSGQVLRRSSSFTVDEAEVFSQAMISLSNQARSAIRDLNPKNDLKFLRIRLRKQEILVAFDPQFIVFIKQRWTIAGDRNLPPVY